LQIIPEGGIVPQFIGGLMRSWSTLGSAVLLAACNGGKDSDPLTGGDDCTALETDVYVFAGPAWGMGKKTMDGTLTMDVDSCAFTFEEWSMMMDDLPSGGVVDGDQVQLDGLNSYWRSCTGTASDEQTIEGTCADDGAAFSIIGS
jgi:hypothetical protein